MAAPTITTQSNASPDLTRRFKFYEPAIYLVGAAPTYTAVANGGMLVDLTQMINVQKAPRGSIPASPLPPNSDIVALQVPIGYEAYLIQNPTNPTLKNFILQIFTSFGGELANGASIPTGLFATTLAAAPPFIFRIKYKNWR